MLNHSRRALFAAVACLALGDGRAAPAFKILYHEAISLETHTAADSVRQMTFYAYGRHFNITLQPNEGIRRAVPANRKDIEPWSGTIEGYSRSWVRMTHTRRGWHGVLSDGHEMYAIEPAADIADTAVQPLTATSSTAPIMYRFADALLPITPAYCEIVMPDGSVVSPVPGFAPSASTAGDQGHVTAQMLYDALAADIASQTPAPHLRLMVGVVADYEFFQQYGDDPEGTIISRMDIVDGIYSSQVGVKITLPPLTIFKTPAQPFSKTVPIDLLNQLRQYRQGSSAQMKVGVTHLMTGRDLDGDVVGISYLGSVCAGDTADSLSEGGHSTIMSALIAAHELGHNFNAPHDGEPGACVTTPQTFLMAPQINFSNQFSQCSLQQIKARIQTAQCLTSYVPPDVTVVVPSSALEAVASSPFTLSFSVSALGDDPSDDVAATVSIPTDLTVQSITADEGTCTAGAGSVTCQFGTLSPQVSRKVDVHLMGASATNVTATISVSSSNDTTSTNNSAQVAVDISATPPVSAASSGSDSSEHGGGGGRVDLTLLALLTALSGGSVVGRLRRGQPTDPLHPPAGPPAREPRPRFRRPRP